MAQPTLTEVHVNRPLTDLSIAYRNQGGYVADRVFPVVPSNNASNLYFSYPKAFWLKSNAQKRAAGTAAARSGYDLETATFTCERDALAHAIPDPIRSNSDVADLDREAMEYVTDQLQRAKEVRWAANYFVTGVWGTSATPSVLWDDAASTPIEDIRTGRRTIKKNTGYDANKLILGYVTADKLLDHPDIIDRIKYGQTAGKAAMANEQILAQLFGVDEVLICGAIQNTGSEGGTAAYSFIAGDNDALLVHAASRPGIRTPSAGYTFTWAGAPGGNPQGAYIKTFRDELNESDIVEGNQWYDQKLVASDLGYFFLNAVT